MCQKIFAYLLRRVMEGVADNSLVSEQPLQVHIEQYLA
jgi:hypothetical protein